MASLRCSSQPLSQLARLTPTRVSLPSCSAGSRSYSSNNTAATPATSPFAPRHFLSISDLSPSELSTVVRNASAHKHALKRSGGNGGDHRTFGLRTSLSNRTIAMPFSKRSTRTRVSTESAVAAMGGNPMFLSSSDIQLGVNESLHDTSVVISSMVAAIVARVGPHSDIAGLARHASVPVINALCDSFHPLQAIADILTVYETPFPGRDDAGASAGVGGAGLGLEGLRIAWVGDANNVLHDLALAAAKLGMHVHVATPRGFELRADMLALIQKAAADAGTGSTIHTTLVPEEAVKDADIIVTDTWVSMGQEAEKAERLRQFEGFQVTSDLAKRGGAKEHWKFMHCLPRKPEEVADEVFFNPQRSLVFPEAENRVYSAITALEAFVVNKGEIREYQS